MKFDLTKPCSNCPFRTDVPFFLSAARAREIAHGIAKEDKTFQCHNTIEYGEEDDDGHCASIRTPQDQHCAGAAIMLEHMNRPNQWMRIAERLGFYDRHKMVMDSPVFRSVAEFVRAMRKLGC